MRWNNVGRQAISVRSAVSAIIIGVFMVLQRSSLCCGKRDVSENKAICTN
jgi:hypothetical protein